MPENEFARHDPRRVGIVYPPGAHLKNVGRDVLTTAERTCVNNPIDAKALFFLGSLADEYGYATLARRSVEVAFYTAPDPDTREFAQKFLQQAPATKRTVRDPYVEGVLAFFAGQIEKAAHLLSAAAQSEPLQPDVVLAHVRAQVAVHSTNDVTDALHAAIASASEPRKYDLSMELLCALFRSGDGKATLPIVCRSTESDLKAAETFMQRRIAHDNDSDPYLQENSEQTEWCRSRDILHYRTEREHPIPYFHSYFREQIRKTLRERPSIRRVVNFGVLCGHSDALLAEEWPNVTFYGIDRSPIVKSLNESHFQRANLRFGVGTVDNFASLIDESVPTLFVHLRTGMCLVPAELRALYAQVARAGMEHVLVIEDFGASRQTGAFGCSHANGLPTVFFRESTFMHDYPYYLREAGYRVVETAILPLELLWKHPAMADGHVQVVHAERVGS